VLGLSTDQNCGCWCTIECFDVFTTFMFSVRATYLGLVPADLI